VDPGFSLRPADADKGRVSGTPAPAATEAVPGLAPPSQRTGVQRRLGDVIVDLGFADREAVESALAEGRDSGHRIGQALVESGVVDSAQLAHALAERNGLPFVDLNEFEVDNGAANLISAVQARRYRAIPIAFLDERTLLTATSDPANLMALDDVAMVTGYEVRLAVTSPEHLEALIGQLSHLSESVHEVEEATDEEDRSQVIELLESAEQAPVVKLVHSVVADAVDRGASDIHFDSRDGDMRVRFRVDGVVIDSTTVARRLVPGLISRIKIMAELDIAERRLPQDGRIGLTVDGRYIDIRVATLPVMRGESVVMRILDKDRVVMELDHLGMEPKDRQLLEHSITRVHGAILATGPTGAGKTTTLYAALNEVNSPDRTLIAIEDPVEYELEGVKQVQVNAKTGLTFASGLRSMIRSDPDVLMVGEIRDRETAQIAIESALTGHLVLSTLHTNDAPMAVARLIEMGIEPFLVASGIECVVAQRLARRLCEDCKQPVSLTGDEMEGNGFDTGGKDIDAFQPGGCVTCKRTGYRGRIGLYEVMVMTPEIRALVRGRQSTGEIGAAAIAGGMRRLRDDGLAKVRSGVTSVPEVLRVLGSGE
jgi:type IV pilus assembly protein PilB